MTLIENMDRAPAPESWDDFLSEIRDAREFLENPDNLWYRGQSKADYKLTPSLLRHRDGLAKEQVLFNEYERSASHLQARRDNDWELLIDMQHYGIPTRLMDWTTVLGVALAFALFDCKDDNEDSALFLLCPKKLNLKTKIKGVIRAANDPKFGYKSIYWHNDPFAAILPIAIDCRLQNPRIYAQQGNFVVHGKDRKDLESLAPECVRKICLPPKLKPSIREFLEFANLHPFTIYPDIGGMARFITRKHLE